MQDWIKDLHTHDAEKSEKVLKPNCSHAGYCFWVY